MNLFMKNTKLNLFGERAESMEKIHIRNFSALSENNDNVWKDIIFTILKKETEFGFAPLLM